MSQPARSISHDVYAYTHSLSSPPSLTPLTALKDTQTHTHRRTHTDAHTQMHTQTHTQQLKQMNVWRGSKTTSCWCFCVCAWMYLTYFSVCVFVCVCVCLSVFLSKPPTAAPSTTRYQSTHSFCIPAPPLHSPSL